jgi:hypothetical protein
MPTFVAMVSDPSTGGGSESAVKLGILNQLPAGSHQREHRTVVSEG